MMMDDRHRLSNSTVMRFDFSAEHVVVYIGLPMSFVITMFRASRVAKELYGTAFRISGSSIRHERPLVKLRMNLPLVMITRE